MQQFNRIQLCCEIFAHCEVIEALSNSRCLLHFVFVYTFKQHIKAAYDRGLKDLKGFEIIKKQTQIAIIIHLVHSMTWF